jgi:hypothetical protein
MFPDSVRLRRLGFVARLGVTCVILTLLGGFAMAGQYMIDHHENRDGEPGLTLTDVMGVYHGVNKPSSLLTALERGHPNEIEGYELADSDRDVLLTWLRSDRVSEDYDNLDLGDAAPAEILDFSCVQCHAANATEGDPAAREIPLRYWDDVEAVAFSREINPTSVEILLASSHTHYIGIGTTLGLICLMMLATRWPSIIAQTLVFFAAFGFMIDAASWWLARYNETFVYVILVGGGLFGVCSGLMLMAILIDLWAPMRRTALPAE